MNEIEGELRALASLWRRERDESRRRNAEMRRSLTLAERVKRGLALKDLEVEETDAAPGGRLMLWIRPRVPIDFETVRIGQGDPVLLYVEEPEEESTVRGVVARRRSDRLGVVVEDDVPDGILEGLFRLDLDDPQATFDRGDRAIRRFREMKASDDRADLRAVLFADQEPRFKAPKETVGPFDRELNEPQERAVMQAMSAQTISLVLGPPGTGKTRTLAEIVRRGVARGEQILVTAASNTAVDNLAERLIDAGVPILRLGHPARVAPAIEAHTLDARLEATAEHALSKRWMREATEVRRRAFTRFARGKATYRDRHAALAESWRLMRDARQQLRNAQDAILARHAVICATAAGADVSLLRSRHFDRVVLDEATQCPDPIALVALGRAPRATLAGDPNQLPPTVIDPQAARDGLGRTFFERIAAGPHGERAMTMLEVQHRMHETLMRFPSEQLYGGRLVAHPSVASQRLEHLADVRADPLRPGPLVFLDSAGKGWVERREGDDPSTDNPGQAERVAKEVERLVSRGVPPSDVAVITPYLAQARALRDRLAGLVARGLEVGTVDGFQGREKEAVLVDLVRSNDDSEIGFLADIRRMNVAITRARRFLMVVGDSATLSRHPFYAAFHAYADEVGAWSSAWDDEGDPLA